MAICLLSFEFNLVSFRPKITVGLFECRLLLTREMGVMDGRTDGEIHGGHQENLQLKKT
jgi:hypothetical protein